MTNINSDLLFEKMSKRLSKAMRKFNSCTGSAQLYWNGYHNALFELQDEIDELVKDIES